MLSRNRIFGADIGKISLILIGMVMLCTGCQTVSEVRVADVNKGVSECPVFESSRQLSVTVIGYNRVQKINERDLYELVIKQNDPNYALLERFRGKLEKHIVAERRFILIEGRNRKMLIRELVKGTGVLVDVTQRLRMGKHLAPECLVMVSVGISGGDMVFTTRMVDVQTDAVPAMIEVRTAMQGTDVESVFDDLERLSLETVRQLYAKIPVVQGRVGRVFRQGGKDAVGVDFGKDKNIRPGRKIFVYRMTDGFLEEVAEGTVTGVTAGSATAVLKDVERKDALKAGLCVITR